MATFILVILFSIFASIQSFAYSIYEMKVNKNKPGGITLMVLSLIGLVFPIAIYLVR